MEKREQKMRTICMTVSDEFFETIRLLALKNHGARFVLCGSNVSFEGVEIDDAGDLRCQCAFSKGPASDPTVVYWSVVDRQSLCNEKEEENQKSLSARSDCEPSNEQIEDLMERDGESYYSARERLRERAYGGPPPCGYASWGDYWKAY